MKIVYVTCGVNGVYGLEYLLKNGVPIHQVITINERVAQANRVSGFADVTSLCQAYKTPCKALDTYQIAEADLGAGELDLLVVNGWNRLIANDVIMRFRLGGIGLHAGHPPIGHGRAPLPWNIIKGHDDLELYVFSLTERADDGDIYARRPIEITHTDDVGSLYEKVMFYGARMIHETILDLQAGIARAAPQDLSRRVLYPKRSPEDGLIDFFLPMTRLYDFIRAQTHPYPGAFSYLDGARWTIWESRPFDAFGFRNAPRRPGEVLAALPSGIVVSTGTTPIWITRAGCDDGREIPASLAEMEMYIGKIFAPGQS